MENLIHIYTKHTDVMYTYTYNVITRYEKVLKSEPKSKTPSERGKNTNNYVWKLLIQISP